MVLWQCGQHYNCQLIFFCLGTDGKNNKYNAGLLHDPADDVNNEIGTMDEKWKPKCNEMK
jgi:hypothetical protein